MTIEEKNLEKDIEKSNAFFTVLGHWVITTSLLVLCCIGYRFIISVYNGQSSFIEWFRVIFMFFPALLLFIYAFIQIILRTNVYATKYYKNKFISVLLAVIIALPFMFLSALEIAKVFNFK